MSWLMAFVAGVTACAWCAVLPDGRVLALAGAACFVLTWPTACPGRLAIRALGMAAFGCAWAAWQASERLAQTLPVSWEGRPVRLVVTLRDLPAPMPDGFRYLAEIERVDTAGARVPERVRLSVRHARPWPPGSRWRLEARLRARRGTANPSGFDVEQWMWGQGVLASGTARAASAVALTPARDLAARIDRLRAGVALRIEGVLGRTREAALIAALTVGDQQRLERREWLAFARTGVIHLVSISGVHVSMLAALAAAVARAVLSSLRPARLSPRMGAMLAGLICAAVYSVLAGWAVPTRRTLLMLSVAGLAVAWRRALSPFGIWWLALAAVLAFDPFAVYAPGLWLSFGLVAALMLSTLGRRHAPRGWRAAGAAQWAATVASVLPLGLFFSTLPLISPLANLLAIPWISALVTPLALMGAALPFDAPLQLAAWLCTGFFRVMHALAASPQWPVARLPWPVLAAGVAGTCWLLAPAGVPVRVLGGLLLLPALLYGPPRPLTGAFRVSVFDVGQGLSVLVTTAGHHLLYDTGGLSGEQVVLPQLSGQGVRRLDALVLSHHDSDHDGAAGAVLAAVPVGQLLVGQAASAAGAGRAYTVCRAGRRWTWDGVEFQVLGPLSGSMTADDNARSCVLRVAGRHGSLLLTGDAPAREEARLVARHGRGLGSTVLLSPHHGSRSSSSPVFLHRVAPRLVVISCGYRNRYGHPHAEVLERYRRLGLSVARTDTSGALELDVGPALRLTGWRASAPRFWRPGPPPSAER